MDCGGTKRILSAYLDGEVTEKKRLEIEEHLEHCRHCIAEKRTLENISSALQKLPELGPAENAQGLFWATAHNVRKNAYVEKLLSVIGEWHFIPLQYPATAMVLMGFFFGLIFGGMEQGSSYHKNLHPAAVEYLALNRMNSIPASTITGTYLSLVRTRHEKGEYKK